MEIDIIDSSYGASPHSPHIQTADAHQTTTLSSILGKRSADDLLFPRKETWKKHAKNENKDSEEILEKLLEAQSNSKIKSLWKRFWKTKAYDQHHILSSVHFMSKVIKKLIDPKLTWEPSLVKLIVSCNMLKARVCAGLIDVILDHKDLNLLSCYIHHVQDISEKDIVKCLNKLLPMESEQLLPELNSFIRELIKLPYTEITLVGELRQLKFERALVLMSYLSTLLKTEEIMKDSGINQIFVWISLLLDAHFAQIIISSEAWKIIVDLQETIADQVEFYKHLSELDVALNKIQSSIATKKLKMEGNKRFLYRIEVMTI